jgi:ribosomal protein S27AE
MKMPRDWHLSYEREYRKNDEVKKKLCERAKNSRDNPHERHKHIARWLVNRALKCGRLQKKPCERCGAHASQAHHDDYSNPLDVRWLCAKHHADEHRANPRSSKAEGK